MMMRKLCVLLALFTTFAGAASAETILAPFIGKAFTSGSSADGFDNSDLVYGGTLSMLGEGPVGFEIDGQYAPEFMGGGNDNHMASFMGAITIGGGQLQGLRFYGCVGAGLLRSHVRSRSDFIEADRNSFGMEAGVSLVMPLVHSLGIKADGRYFRALTDVSADTLGEIDLGPFRFWRISVGAAIRF